MDPATPPPPTVEMNTNTASLDTFFRRLGHQQGGSRIWGSKGRPTAVPGSLRATSDTQNLRADPVSNGGTSSSATKHTKRGSDDSKARERSKSREKNHGNSRSPVKHKSMGGGTGAQLQLSPEVHGSGGGNVFKGVAAGAAWVSPARPISPPPEPLPAPPPTELKAEGGRGVPLSFRESKYEKMLGHDVVKLPELRSLSWNGVPAAYRPTVWRLLCGYMPANKDRRDSTLQRKRREYEEAVAQYFDVADTARTVQEQALLRQVLVDVPRTSTEPLFQLDHVQQSMTRVLYVWAVRHPASGYVQGINDLLTPFYMVFLGDAATSSPCEVEEKLLREVEADTYWCLTKLLDNIQDHYTAMQPGLQRMVLRLEELIRRIDQELHGHIIAEGLQFIQFAFRWMNCLLMRELPLRTIIRAWDTYLSEEPQGGGSGFEGYHIYVCAALLCKFSPQLLELDFQSLVMFLQDLPTKEWKEMDVEPLLSQAYILSTLFEDSSAHLT